MSHDDLFVSVIGSQSEGAHRNKRTGNRLRHQQERTRPARAPFHPQRMKQHAAKKFMTPIEAKIISWCRVLVFARRNLCNAGPVPCSMTV